MYTFVLKVLFILKKLVFGCSQSTIIRRAYNFEGNHGNKNYLINWFVQCNRQGNLIAARCQQEMLANFVPQLHDDEMEVGYFQQDEAIAHSDKTTKRELFDNSMSVVKFDSR